MRDGTRRKSLAKTVAFTQWFAIAESLFDKDAFVENVGIFWSPWYLISMLKRKVWRLIVT
jgi:hypothetical protein